MYVQTQILRISRAGPSGSARYITRTTTSAARNTEDAAPFTGWSVRSPRDLYNHLSKYVVGQEKAKRTLSVAVFNHYHRISPRLPPRDPPPPPPPPTPEKRQAPPIILDPPITPSSGSSRLSTWERPRREDFDPATWDPSRGGTQLEDGFKRDATKVTGADGTDPTLTHDLLTLRSREGQWARDGYFSARPPPPLPSLLGQSMKKRRSSTQETTDNSNEGNSAGRKGITVESEQEPRLPLIEDELPGSLDSKEEVIIEKSNVLMVGPTGTGKTLMAKTLAQILDVPFASCDATTYTQAGYVGEDVENCVLRLLQNAEFDVNRAEVGIIHIDEIDKLSRRGGGEFGSWGGGRDVGGEGVQQALLRLLEGTTLTLQAKGPAISSSPPSNPTNPSNPLGGAGPTSPGTTLGPKAESKAAYGDPPGWDPNNPMNRSLGGKKSVREGLPGFSSGGGAPGGKGETYVVDTSNILFVLSGAFVGLDQIVNRRLGKGSIGFGAPLPKKSSEPTSSTATLPLTGLSTPDLTTYGLIPEFLGRLPVISILSPLTLEDMIRILVEPRNALIKQYQSLFEKYGSQLRFTEKAIRELAKEGLNRGGGARGLRSIMEEVLADSMFEVPGSSVRYCLITESVIKHNEPALYFSRGQRIGFLQAIEDEDGVNIINQEIEDAEEEHERLSATG
ncbi:ATP-dependent Clp protease, ATP-binding subunit ClpX [Kwoniella dendrophila CBS 6074]|uniref:ATP-dependent Clp protease, ATP-binding subunit ClpX n=1 Tax=Kwoniella dendrophila CBS 6074 TaxID=1295534 RepID=A0AAX4JKQ7_9TREE